MKEALLLTAVIIFLAVYAILVLDKINRAVVSLLGASLVILLGVLDQEKAVAGVDFNTIGLLIGMMIIVAVCQKTGMFQYVAIRSVKIVHGEPWRILVMLGCVTAIISAFLDNVTTVLLVAPLTILMTEEMQIDPYPFLFVEILMSNIGGTATLIGDPPNIMIGSAADLNFMDFVKNLTPVVLIVMTSTFAPIYLIYRKRLKVDSHVRERVMQFNERDALRDIPLLKKCLFVLAAVIVAFLFQHRLHLEAATIAISGAAILLLITGDELHTTLEKLEWTTIFFFAGLFIVVRGLDEAGVIKILAQELIKTTSGNLAVTTIAILWVSAIASAFVDNIPFVATMIPLIKEIGVEMGGHEAIMPLWWALSLGACLGGNGTLIGASANVVVAGIAGKAGHHFRFIEFMKLAFPMMLLSIVLSTIYLYLRYL
ncbi:MAG: ArsB/NhaD family transporter [Deltaproteobacteria bacterium]|nr:ArsB/NhaD family transporter [Deltaproteobacteria bacterium]